jgi:hypothetical protein
MIDKNNNITLIFVLLFVIFVVYYYDKHYKCKIENLENQIEQFAESNLQKVEKNVEKELKEMDNIENKYGFIFKDNDKERKILKRTKDGKLLDFNSINNKEDLEKNKTKGEKIEEITLNPLLNTKKIMETNKEIHEKVKKINFHKIRNDVLNYVQNKRISNLEEDASKYLEMNKSETDNNNINSIKNSAHNKLLTIKKVNNEQNHYIIRMDDPKIIEENEKLKTQIYELGGRNVDNNWILNLDNMENKNVAEIENKINSMLNKIIENNKDKVKCLYFNNDIKDTISDSPYGLKICNEKYDKSQLMKIHNIELEDGCFNIENNKFISDDNNLTCKTDLNKELRPNKDKFLCNYNQHVNYPYLIEENELEFLPKKISIVKPVNFKPPKLQIKENSLTQQNKQIFNDYRYAFDYMSTSNNYEDSLMYENPETIEDNEYKEKCQNKYNLSPKKSYIESCLTIDKEGISFQDCNLRKNQRWTTSSKKTYC